MCVYALQTLQSVGNECPERSLLHLTDPVIAFPPQHLSSSARPVMIAGLKSAKVDTKGCKTARWLRWRLRCTCVDVAKVSGSTVSGRGTWKCRRRRREEMSRTEVQGCDLQLVITTKQVKNN